MPIGPGAGFLLLATGSGGGAFLVDVAATDVDLPAVATVFFAAGLTAGFALVAGLAGCFAVFAAPDLAPPGTFAFAGVPVDFTALFTGAFFAAGLAADFFAGVSESVKALTIFFAKVFTGDLAALLEDFADADFTAEVPLALVAVFFVLLADFVTVAFMVPCPSTNLPTPALIDCRALEILAASRLAPLRRAQNRHSLYQTLLQPEKKSVFREVLSDKYNFARPGFVFAPLGTHVGA